MLRQRRKEAGLSQRELSELSGVPLRTIQHWELKGVENGTVKNVLNVSKALGLLIDQLVTDEYDDVLIGVNDGNVHSE